MIQGTCRGAGLRARNSVCHQTGVRALLPSPQPSPPEGRGGDDEPQPSQRRGEGMELHQNWLLSDENRVRRTMSSFVARGSGNAERLKCLMRWRMGDTGFVRRTKGRFVAPQFFRRNWGDTVSVRRNRDRVRGQGWSDENPRKSSSCFCCAAPPPLRRNGPERGRGQSCSRNIQFSRGPLPPHPALSPPRGERGRAQQIV